MPEILGRLRPPRISAPPISPALGEMYFDTVSSRLYWWNGASWTSAGAGTGIYAGSGVPGSGLGILGDLYMDTATGLMYEKRSVGTVPAFRSSAGFAESSTQNSHTCGLPAGYQVGDLLILFVTMFHSGVGDAAPAPTGWTRHAQNSPQAGYNFAIYTRVADGTEGTTVILSLVNSNANMACLAYSGSLGVDIFGDFGSVQTTTTPTIPSVLTTAHNDIVVGLFGGGAPGGATTAQASGWTERWDAVQSFANTYIYAMERAQPIAGASPTAQPTVSPSAGNFWAYTLAVKSPTGTASWVRLGSYVTIADEGSSLSQRPTLNFVGAGVTATDDSANARTVVTIPTQVPADATASVKGIVQLAGDLAGTAASPQIASGVIVDGDVATANKDGAVGTPSLRTLGVGAQQAAPGNDSRFLPTDIVVVAATRILANKLLSGDTYPAYRIMGDGLHQWGPGGSTMPDASFYRNVAGSLRTDGQFQAMGELFARVGDSRQVIIGDAGNTFPGFRLGNPADTFFYRVAAGQLATPGQFRADGLIVANNTGGTGGKMVVGYSPATNAGIEFGTDTYLYRAAANVLMTGGSIYAVGAIHVNEGSASMVQIHTDGGIYFGSAGDAVLYRSGAAALNTNSSFNAAALSIAGVPIYPLPARLGEGAQFPVPGNDLNNAKQNGWYYVQNTDANVPEAWWGALHVVALDTTSLRQVLYSHAKMDVWQRQFSIGVWSTWEHTYPVVGAGTHATTHEPNGLDPMAVDAVAATGSLRTLGTGAKQAAAGNDSRFVPTTRTAEAFLTTAQAISVATYADLTGCSITLAAGTWLIIAEMSASAANLAFLAHLAITDNANVILRETSGGAPASGTASVHQWASLSCSAIVTPGASTTYKLRAARGLTTLTNTFTAQDGSGANVTNNASSATDKGTSIRAIRIA